MIQLLFNANLLLFGAFGIVGIIMLTGMAMDATQKQDTNV